MIKPNKETWTERQLAQYNAPIFYTCSCGKKFLKMPVEVQFCDGFFWFNCDDCHSTMVSEEWKPAVKYTGKYPRLIEMIKYAGIISCLLLVEYVHIIMPII